MKKIILIPDSFKGTMSSARSAPLWKRQSEKVFLNAEILSIPVADGGEGTVEAFIKACQGEIVYCDASDPYF